MEAEMLKKQTTKYQYLEIYNNFSKRIFPMPKGRKVPYNKMQYPNQQNCYIAAKERDITKAEFDRGFGDITNAGIFGGKESGIIILDLDSGIHNSNNPSSCNKQHILLGAPEDNCDCLLGKPYSGIATLKHYGLYELAMKSAIAVDTVSGGLHLYYKWNKDVNCDWLNWLTMTSCNKCGEYTSRLQGIDIRNSTKGFVLLPPSMYKGNDKWREYTLHDGTTLHRDNLQPMPQELVDFINEGMKEKHTSGTHKQTKIERFSHTINEADYDGVDIEAIEWDKRPLSNINKRHKNKDEIKYKKDRYVRRKAFTPEGRLLARFDNDLGLAQIGTTEFIKELRAYAWNKGLDMSNPKDVDKIVRKTVAYLREHRQKKFIIHPISKEVYTKIGRFFVYVDIHGKNRPPLPRKDFSLDDSIVEKELDKNNYLSIEDLDKYMSDDDEV